MAGKVEAGGAFVRLFTDKSPMIRGLKSARKDFDSWAAGISGAGAKLAAVGAVGAGISGAALKSFADAGSLLNDMAARTGVSVEALSKLKFAAEQNGSSLEGLEGGLKKYGKTLVAAQSGNAEAVQAFRTLGIGMQDLDGKSADDQMALIGERLMKLPPGAQRATAAMGLFGKSGADLVPVLTDLRANMDRAAELGLGWTTEEAANADAVGDRFDELKDVALRTVTVIGGALAPAFLDLSEPLLAAAVATKEFVSENPDLVTTVAMVTAGIGGAGVALLGVAGALTVVSTAIGAFSTLWLSVGAALASPIVLPAAIAALGYVLTTQTNMGRSAITGLRSEFPGVAGAADEMAARAGAGFAFVADEAAAVGADAKTSWQGIVDAVSSGNFELAGEIAMAGFQAVWQRGVGLITDAWTVTSSEVVSIWTDTIAGIQGVGVDLSAWFSSMWADIKGFAFGAFDSIMSKWDKVSGSIADTIIDVSVSTGIMSGDAEEIKQTRREDTAGRSAGREQRGESRVTDKAAELAAIESQRRAGRSAIETERAAAQQRIQDEQNAALNATDKAKRNAQQKLNDLAAKATEGRKPPKPEDEKPPKPVGMPGDFGGEKKAGGGTSEATTSGIIASLNRGGPADSIVGPMVKQQKITNELLKGKSQNKPAAVNDTNREIKVDVNGVPIAPQPAPIAPAAQPPAKPAIPKVLPFRQEAAESTARNKAAQNRRNAPSESQVKQRAKRVTPAADVPVPEVVVQPPVESPVPDGTAPNPFPVSPFPPQRPLSQNQPDVVNETNREIEFDTDGVPFAGNSPLFPELQAPVESPVPPTPAPKIQPQSQNQPAVLNDTNREIELDADGAPNPPPVADLAGLFRGLKMTLPDLSDVRLPDVSTLSQPPSGTRETAATATQDTELLMSIRDVLTRLDSRVAASGSFT